MRYADAVDAVQVEAATPSLIEADRATQATLRVLSVRLNGCHDRRLALQLPAPLAAEIVDQDRGEEFAVEEFYARVAARSGTDLMTARTRARAVVTVLRRFLPDSLSSIEGALPADYLDLLSTRGDEVTSS